VRQREKRVHAKLGEAFSFSSLKLGKAFSVRLCFFAEEQNQVFRDLLVKFIYFFFSLYARVEQAASGNGNAAYADCLLFFFGIKLHGASFLGFLIVF
jgi:hypothetical protein